MVWCGGREEQISLLPVAHTVGKEPGHARASTVAHYPNCRDSIGRIRQMTAQVAVLLQKCWPHSCRYRLLLSDRHWRLSRLLSKDAGWLQEHRGRPGFIAISSTVLATQRSTQRESSEHKGSYCIPFPQIIMALHPLLPSLVIPWLFGLIYSPRETQLFTDSTSVLAN